jgi:hypothetical protein
MTVSEEVLRDWLESRMDTTKLNCRVLTNEANNSIASVREYRARNSSSDSAIVLIKNHDSSMLEVFEDTLCRDLLHASQKPNSGEAEAFCKPGEDSLIKAKA